MRGISLRRHASRRREILCPDDGEHPFAKLELRALADDTVGLANSHVELWPPAVVRIEVRGHAISVALELISYPSARVVADQMVRSSIAIEDLERFEKSDPRSRLEARAGHAHVGAHQLCEQLEVALVGAPPLDFDVVTEIWYPDRQAYTAAMAAFTLPANAERIARDEENVFDRSR